MTQDERSAIERQVAGAIRSAIDAHGPIDRTWISSAAKRVVSQLIAADLVGTSREERNA